MCVTVDFSHDTRYLGIGHSHECNVYIRFIYLAKDCAKLSRNDVSWVSVIQTKHAWPTVQTDFKITSKLFKSKNNETKLEINFINNTLLIEKLYYK